MRLLAVGLFFTLSTYSANVQAARVFRGETNFAQLINKYAQGSPQQIPWIGYWWPYQKGGLTAKDQDAYGMSPVEKFDHAYRAHLHAQGHDVTRYVPAFDWEHEKHGPARDGLKPWSGHADGWAAAALLFPEPRDRTIHSGIVFEPADIKALASETAMGIRRTTYGTPTNHEDLPPNQLFLILTNHMGARKQGIVIDRHTGEEIRQHPLAGYVFDYPLPENYLGADPHYRNIYRVRLTARVWWASNEVPLNARSPKFALSQMRDKFDDPFYPGRKFEMELWLDAPVEFDAFGRVTRSGNLLQIQYGSRIVGGKWHHDETMPLDERHPDFAWVPDGTYLMKGKHSAAANPRLDVSWIRQALLNEGNNSSD